MVRLAGERHSDNQLLLSALRHPLRRSILREMADEEPVSPVELAGRLKERLGNVAYHVQVLAACGAIVAAGQRQVRGATQHFYRWALTAEWARKMLDEYEAG